jgi:hypothetical protein
MLNILPDFGEQREIHQAPATITRRSDGRRLRRPEDQGHATSTVTIAWDSVGSNLDQPSPIRRTKRRSGRTSGC